MGLLIFPSPSHFPSLNPSTISISSGGQVIEFVDELVDLVFKRFYTGLFLWIVEVIGGPGIPMYISWLRRNGIMYIDHFISFIPFLFNRLITNSRTSLANP